MRARAAREQEALDRAVWESENPEEAAEQKAVEEAQIAKLKALTAACGLSAEQREWSRRQAELKARAERCGECDRPFAAGDTIYRRAEHGATWGPVLPYCRDHVCAAYTGRHNRDAGEGRYYPACGCLDDGHGSRRWLEPKPCDGCGRLVANDRESANPRRFTRDSMTPEEDAERRRLLDACETPEERRELGRELRWGPVARTFCSEGCRRAFYRDERRQQRTPVEPVRCEACRREFTPATRSDARYCSNRCRQRAYRRRRAANEKAPQ